ncbi:tyrosine-type recombinase/integrase [Roseateles oligotrophus]|uniref:Tyrosine-type recombinase/integrase n=1 Tax=Roseateles oligotrophus TaxID=1769250 RepID=A0ABT2Y9P2_9BURK|nr:tyrosine-type recombinase/integrase [Roseateles oligotrophus]MCV2367019.1 tyrosine-type recombinase/integrase [Roseateles oligotrophus]
MATRIDTVASREKLKPRRGPYWHRLSKGCYIGFRKMTSGGTGVWQARARDENATVQQRYQPLGEFLELADHLRFDAAAKAANAWFEHLGRGGTAQAATVSDACSRYVIHLKATKADHAATDAEARFNNYVLNHKKLAATELSKLTPAQLEAWRKSLRELPTRSGGNRGGLRSTSTLNRDMTCFRAALNLAYLDGQVTTDFAWRSKLRPIKDADQRRELYLDRAQRLKFIETAPADLGAFLRGLCQLPLRPGALAKLTAGDFDRRLKVLRIGHDKGGKDRRIKLPDVTAAFFDTAAKDKLPAAPLLARADGKAWNKDSWKWPIKTTAAMAQLPDGTTAYTLRHSVISDLVHDGLDLLTVAQISGTSVAMIERHYGHLRSDVAAGALSRLAL